MDKSTKWFPFEHFRANGCSNEVVVSCYLGKAFHIWSSRNAWWGYESNRYPEESFFPSLAAAKAAVEQARIQGSRWQIDELPACVISAQSNCLLVMQINTKEPFRNVTTPDSPLLTLEEIGQFFRPAQPNSIIRMIGAVGILSVGELPFWRHRSQPMGPRNVPLRWNRAAPAPTLQLAHVMHSIAAVNEGLQKDPWAVIHQQV